MITELTAPFPDRIAPDKKAKMCRPGCGGLISNYGSWIQFRDCESIAQWKGEAEDPDAFLD